MDNIRRGIGVESGIVTMTINGHSRAITVEPRTTLLDALRTELGLIGTKKGCDRGECGACTILVDDPCTLSCMALAVMQAGKEITTIEGLEQNGQLHPSQRAFIEHDAFQRGCGDAFIPHPTIHPQGSIAEDEGCDPVGVACGEALIFASVSGLWRRLLALPRIKSPAPSPDQAKRAVHGPGQGKSAGRARRGDANPPA